MLDTYLSHTARYREAWPDTVDASSSQRTVTPHHGANVCKLLSPVFQCLVDLMQGLSLWLWNSTSARTVFETNEAEKIPAVNGRSNFSLCYWSAHRGTSRMKCFAIYTSHRYIGIESVPGFSMIADSPRLMPICLNVCWFCSK